MNEWISLREERDFGEKFNATFQFTRQNIKNLGLTLLLLGSPLLIAGSLITAYLQLELGMGSIQGFQQLPSGFWGYLALLVIVNVIAYSWLLTITFSYIAEYLNGNRDITPTQVFIRAVGKIGRVLGASVIVSLISFFGMLLLVIPGIYLMIALSFVSVIIIVEDDPAFEAISRSIKLISGKWWSTFGLIFVMSIVTGLMQLIFNIPALIVTIPKALHQTQMVFDAGAIVTQAIASVGSTLLYPLVFIAIAFQYFNLVERKESEGLKQQIRMAGEQAVSTPKNEGEY